MNIPNDGGWSKDWGAPKSDAIPGLADARNGFIEAFSSFWRRLSRNWAMVASVALAGTGGLGIGLLAAQENQPSKDPLWIEQLPPEELPVSAQASTTPVEQAIGQSTGQATEQPTQSAGQGSDSAGTHPAAPPASHASPLPPKTGNYVASKTGTKYYLPTCATAKRIKDANKRYGSRPNKRQKRPASSRPPIAKDYKRREPQRLV